MFDYDLAEVPKYWHTQDMYGVKYVKSEVLYALYQNAKLITNEDYVVIVEGPFDVAALLEAGIPAVSPLGVAFSNDHGFQLLQFTNNWISWLDMDKAGKSATDKLVSIAKTWGAGVELVTSGDMDIFKSTAKDASEYLENHGVKGLRELIKWKTLKQKKS